MFEIHNFANKLSKDQVCSIKGAGSVRMCKVISDKSFICTIVNLRFGDLKKKLANRQINSNGKIVIYSYQVTVHVPSAILMKIANTLFQVKQMAALKKTNEINCYIASQT